MTFRQAMEYIDHLKPVGMQMGLDRMEEILRRLGDPHQRLRTVHIAGTNGKGSTARMIQAALTASGYHAALFSSPAVTGLRDTITIDGRPIGEKSFASCVERIRQAADDQNETIALSEFEVETALAFLWFCEQRADICVIECGLGGRDDATNVLPAPLLAILTPVSLDHTALLGSTAAEIAEVKCGILKKGTGAVITAPGQCPEALAEIMAKVAEEGLTLYQPQPGGLEVQTEEPGNTVFYWRGDLYTLPLTGRFQAENAMTALQAIECLRAMGWRLPAEAVKMGLAEVVMPCRQEIVRRQPLVMLDGAHNPQGIAALAGTLHHLLHGERVTVVMGMLGDKDTTSCVHLLAPIIKEAICCAPDNPRALAPELLAAVLQDAGVAASAASSPQKALERAMSVAQNGPLLICGSFYLCSVLRPYLTQSGFLRQKNNGSDGGFHVNSVGQASII